MMTFFAISSLGFYTSSVERNAMDDIVEEYMFHSDSRMKQHC
jgi:hypothetical protein